MGSIISARRVSYGIGIMPYIRHLRFDNAFDISPGTITKVDVINTHPLNGNKSCLLTTTGGDVLKSYQGLGTAYGMFWEVLSPLEELAMQLEE